MYQFVSDIKKDEYKKFYIDNNACFMQSYEWGEFNKVSRNQIPHYVGLKKDGNIICEALLLEKRMLNLSYFYSPRGFIIDFNDKNLLEEFTNHLKEYIKKKNGIYLKLDPEIEYQEIDENGNKVENGFNNYQVYNNLINLHFKHTGFIKNFENNQPRYTFIIDLNKDLDTLYNNINKSVLKKIKKTYEYDMEFRESNDIDTFYKLLSITSKKDDFTPYTKEYYKKAYEIMDGAYKLFELIINPKKLYDKTKTKLEDINKKLAENISSKQLNNLNASKERLIKELQELDNYKELDELVICSQICAVTNNKVWTLYIGNDEIGKNLYAVNRMYWEIIKYSKETNHKYLDLFGTTGDVLNAHKNLGGIHKFKQNFGGRYVEFVGEFDYINKKFLYKILPIVLKIYRKRLKRKTISK